MHLWSSYSIFHCSIVLSFVVWIGPILAAPESPNISSSPSPLTNSSTSSSSSQPTSNPSTPSPSTTSSSSPSNSTDDTTASPTAQLAKPPILEQSADEAAGTTMPMGGQTETLVKAPIVTRQTPPAPFAALKPESKDEMFARIDTDGDNAITLQDYMNRDRYYVESVRTEFNDIDTNRDGTVTKGEFDAFIQRLDEQRRAAMMNASNFTLMKNDADKDGELSVDELGEYINGTLQRSVAQLPRVFRQFDKDGNGRLNLDEFHELDFNFPWEKFPPAITEQQQQQMQSSQNRQMFFNANAPVAPPFMNEQASAEIPSSSPVMPLIGAASGQIQAQHGGYGGPPPIPMPKPVVRFLRWTA